MSECPDCGLDAQNCDCGEYFDDEADCGMCGGEGWFFGEDLPTFSFGWHDPEKSYACPSCHGTGLRKDMTIW